MSSHILYNIVKFACLLMISLYFSDKNLNHVQSILQADLNIALKWLDNLLMPINQMSLFWYPISGKNGICNITSNSSVLHQIDNIKILVMYILMLTYVGSTILTPY